MNTKGKNIIDELTRQEKAERSNGDVKILYLSPDNYAVLLEYYNISIKETFTVLHGMSLYVLPEKVDYLLVTTKANDEQGATRKDSEGVTARSEIS